VEIWLSRLSLKIRKELNNVLVSSKQMADEYFNSVEIKEEEKMDWIFNFCA